MEFLPEGYNSLTSKKAYWKPSEMKEGENKLRIVQRPIAGWIDWKDKKPYRYRPEDKPLNSFDPEKPMKAFWNCYVWDYTRQALFILEISQQSIINSLVTFAKDEDWGDFMQYDIKIVKEGTGKETKYEVMPLPHKPLPAGAVLALEQRPVNLEALYEGKDPWTDLVTTRSDAGPANAGLSSCVEQIFESFENEGIDTDGLFEWIENRAAAKVVSVENMADAMLKNIANIKSQYLKETAKRLA